MAAQTPLFEGVEQVHLRLDGHDVVAPFRYHSGTAMAGVFAARSSALAAKAPHPSLRPALLAPGVSPVVVLGFEFETDHGPLNEVCVAVPLRRGRLPVPLASLLKDLVTGDYPTWIWHLPVSNEVADVHGRTIWGFPKIVADIEVTETDGRRTTAMSVDGVPVLALHGPSLDGGLQVDVRFVNHLWQDGSHVQKADQEFRLADVGLSLRPGAARLELHPEHPVARDLDDVLLSRRSLNYLHARRLQSLLGMPQVLTPALLERLQQATDAFSRASGPVAAAS